MGSLRRGGALAAVLAAFGAVVVILLVMGLVFGWVGWSDDSQRTTLEVDKVELQQDTDEAVDATKKVLHRAAETIEDAARDLGSEDDEQLTPVPDESELQNEEL